MAALSAERYLAASGLNLQDYHQSPAVRVCIFIYVQLQTHVQDGMNGTGLLQEHRDEEKIAETQELAVDGELDMQATRHRGQYGTLRMS